VTSPRRLLTPAEVAEQLQIGRTAVYDLIASGDLPVVDVRSPGSKRARSRITEADLKAFIASRTRKAS
jgi:excisionase family DNA binding protein